MQTISQFKRFILCGLLWVGLFLAGPQSAWAVKWGWQPSIETRDQQLSFLLELRERLPQLFLQGFQKHVDFFRLIDRQSQVVSLLKKEPVYVSALDGQEMLQLVITPPIGGIPVGQVVIRPEAIAEWKQELLSNLEAVRQGAAGFEGLESLFDQIREQSEYLNDDRIEFSEKLLGRVKRAGVIAKDLQRQIREGFRIQQSVLNTLLRRYHARGIGDSLVLVEGMIEQWGQLSQLVMSNGINLADLLSAKKILESEAALVRSMSLLVFFKVGSKVDDSTTWDDLKLNFESIDESDLIDLHDPTVAFGSRVWHGLQTSKVRTVEPSSLLVKIITDTLSKRFHFFATQTQEIADRAIHGLRLIQVPPVFAIFRGFVGSDCSTRLSFPYPNDPNELVFFVTRSETDRFLKGYVSASRVKVDGDVALYLHTISGSHLTAGDVELIMRGLDQSKEIFGANKFLLPTESNVQKLMNFPPIREVFMSHLKAKPLVHVEYSAPTIRGLLEDFDLWGDSYNSGTYDHISQHAQAKWVDWKDQYNGVLVDTIPVAREWFSKLLDRHSQKEFLLEMLIDFNLKGMFDAEKQIFKIDLARDLIPREQFHEWLKIYRQGPDQEAGECISKFVDRMDQELLKYFGISGHFFKLRLHLLYPQVVYCSDAFSDGEIEKIAKLATDDFKWSVGNAEHTPWVKIHESLKNGSLGKTRAFQRLFHRLTDLLHYDSTRELMRVVGFIRQLRFVSDEVQLSLLTALTRADFSPVDANEIKTTLLEAIKDISLNHPALDQTLKHALAQERNVVLKRRFETLLLQVRGRAS